MGPPFVDECMTAKSGDRRPLRTRDAGWARKLASVLARSPVTANQISMASVLFALAGAASLLLWRSPLAMLVCAACIQLRLLCNLLDGMLAIEGGRSTPAGPLYNEFPDRIADALFLVALGHAAGEPWLGWLCALLAALTAYIRVTGGSLGLPQDFRGPMAKPHRMAAMTVACLLGPVEAYWLGSRGCLLAAAWLIALGSALTCVLRTRAIAAQLRARQEGRA